MIVIIEGCGTNLISLQVAIERLGKKVTITRDVTVIKRASHVILPGVNSAKAAMQKLKDNQLITCIKNLQQPVLGICVGMQVLYDYSEENDVTCLGIIPGIISKLKTEKALTLPHMGWNRIHTKTQQHGAYFYYAHSYCAKVSKHTIATTTYGEAFTAIVKKQNFYGVQFHPERSGRAGELILKNFLAGEFIT